jgi:hypothetical protein
MKKIRCFFGIHKWNTFNGVINYSDTSNYRSHNLPCIKRKCIYCNKGQWLDNFVVSNKNAGWRNYVYSWGNLGKI